MRDGRRPDPGAVVAGLFFLAVAAYFIADSFHHDPLVPPNVQTPAVLIGLGAVGIVRTLTRTRRRNRPPGG